MTKKLLYQKAYAQLDKSTPLRFDCGRLCDKTCCRVGDDETGMYLFPGEEIMYTGLEFPTIITSNFETGPNQKVLLALCRGKCDRSLRPLTCRFFPLTPFINPKGFLLTKIDPRAEEICPLSREQLNPEFIKNVRQVSQMLIADPEIKLFIEKLSAMLAEYEKLPWFRLVRG